jgi:hypothetical protein
MSPPPSPGPVEVDVDEAQDHTTASQNRRDDPPVPIQVEPVEAEMSPPRDTGPATDAVLADSDETADALREPEASAEGSNGPAPIDRLEAEITRLLGRAPTR